MRIPPLTLAVLTGLLPLCSAQDEVVAAPPLNTPEERQAAVERSLLPSRWVESHAFGMTERMSTLDVPGVSVAVIHDGKIDWAAGYGVRDSVSGEPVTTETLFQAASISKSVSALAALKLAQEERFDIDAPISDILTSYELPETGFEGDVTPRRILNHTAGLGVHGFAGYRTDERIPTAVEVLAGLGNSDAVLRVDNAGERMSYSGGGSTLLQVALTDLTGKDFAAIVQERVLTPLGMTGSTYAQPLPTKKWTNYSAAHDHGGRRIFGGFHVYPEQFPAGLWTTPTDLARFALEVQKFAAGKDGQVLNADWGQTMLTPVFERPALGLFISEYGGVKWFGHSGSNMGFKCKFRASFTGGQGVVVMTNSEMGAEVFQDVIRAVAKVYEWPGVIREPLKEALLTPAQLERYAGRYAFEPDEVVFVTREKDRLMLQQLPYPRLPLAPLGDHRFHLLGTEFHIDFQGEGPGGATSLSMSMNSERKAARLDGNETWPVESLLFGEAQDAIPRYLAAHGADETDPMVDCDRLIGLSRSLLRSRRPLAALALAKAVTDLYPRDAAAWYALGHARSGLGRHKASAAAYRSCMEQISNDASLDAGERERLKADTQTRLRMLESAAAQDSRSERSK